MLGDVMVSYSQNQEDVVLHRLIKFIENGTYVDVGAGHPILDNVTYALYLNNWRGVNIEPMEREANLLRETRPNDVTVQTGVSNFEGHMTLYEAPLENRGSSTTDLDLVSKYRQKGQDFQPVEAEVCTLTSVFERYVVGECHVLKIDVEGAEREVLQGFDLPRFRPWVIVVEAILPQSTIDSSHLWEQFLFDAGYRETLFDGLNKFYVRDDLTDIAEEMSKPANVFDNWKTSEVNDLKQQAFSLQATMTEMYANYLLEAESFNHEAENFKNSLSEIEIYVQSLINRAERAEEYAQSLEKRLST